MKLNEELKVTITNDYKELLKKARSSHVDFKEAIDYLKVKYVSYKEIKEVITYDKELLYTCILFDYHSAYPYRLKLLNELNINVDIVIEKEKLPKLSTVNIYETITNNFVSPIALFIFIINFYEGVTYRNENVSESLLEFIKILTKNKRIDESKTDFLIEDNSFINYLIKSLFNSASYKNKEKTNKIESSYIKAINYLINKGANYESIKILLIHSYMEKIHYKEELLFPEIFKLITKNFNIYKELHLGKSGFISKNSLLTQIRHCFKKFSISDEYLFLKILLKKEIINYFDVEELYSFLSIGKLNNIFHITKEQKKINNNKIQTILKTIED